MSPAALALDTLERSLIIEFERAMRQRDAYAKTGVSTAGHVGSHDTCIGHILRTHFALQPTTAPLYTVIGFVTRGIFSDKRLDATSRPAYFKEST